MNRRYVAQFLCSFHPVARCPIADDGLTDFAVVFDVPDMTHFQFSLNSRIYNLLGGYPRVKSVERLRAVFLDIFMSSLLLLLSRNLLLDVVGTFAWG